MVSAVYEHIVIILIVGVIFVGTVVALPAINYSSFQAVDQQQVKNTALNLFNSILLGVGSPADWGSKYPFDQNEVNNFGLARSIPFSKYVLDSDKVQRLDQDSPGYIEYDRVRDLLQLQNYGFRLSIYRPFKVNWTLNITPDQVHFSVTVTRAQDGAPIPNADVKVTVMATASKIDKKAEDPPISEPFPPSTYTTDAAGKCQDVITANLSGYEIRSAVAIMQITVAGMSTTVVAQNDDPITCFVKINTFGDNVVLSIREEELLEEDPGAARIIFNAWAYKNENLFNIFEGREKITWGQGYETVSMTFPGLTTLNPTALLFLVQITLKRQGPTPVLIVGPFSFGDSEKIFEFGPEPQAENIIATLRRFVVISDMTYITEIALWKEAQ